MLLYVFVGNAIVVFDVLFVIVVIVVAGVVFCFLLFFFFLPCFVGFVAGVVVVDVLLLFVLFVDFLLLSLSASSYFYKRSCPSVGRSVSGLVGWLVGW